MSTVSYYCPICHTVITKDIIDTTPFDSINCPKDNAKMEPHIFNDDDEFDENDED